MRYIKIMILRIEELKELCSVILPAVDATDFSSLTDTLELYAHDGRLEFAITNKEYFLDTYIVIEKGVDFKATINANLFLKLISQTTTDTVEFEVDNQSLILKGNGRYKLPLIYDGDKLFELPKIDIVNKTKEFILDGNILYSILISNTKQLSVGTLSRPVQKLYYVDEQGCITFTSGACVNKFILPEAVKLLLNQRLVKLFKLFKDKSVKVTIGEDALNEEITQTKVKFDVNNLSLTAILSNDVQMLNQVPVNAIRSRADNVYQHIVGVSKQHVIDAINRIKLFVSDSRSSVPYAKFVFTNDYVVISDLKNENKEQVFYSTEVDNLTTEYGMYLDLNELLAILDTCVEQHVTLSFGDNQALILKRSNIVNIIPEVRIDTE